MINYLETAQELDEGAADIIHGRPVIEGGSRSKYTHSDPTAAKAIRLYSDRRLAYCAKVIRAIELALKIINDPAVQGIFKLYYLEGRGRVAVTHELYCTEQTFYRQRRRLINMVAAQLGLKAP